MFLRRCTGRRFLSHTSSVWANRHPPVPLPAGKHGFDPEFLSNAEASASKAAWVPPRERKKYTEERQRQEHKEAVRRRLETFLKSDPTLQKSVPADSIVGVAEPPSSNETSEEVKDPLAAYYEQVEITREKYRRELMLKQKNKKSEMQAQEKSKSGLSAAPVETKETAVSPPSNECQLSLQEETAMQALEVYCTRLMRWEKVERERHAKKEKKQEQLLQLYRHAATAVTLETLDQHLDEFFRQDPTVSGISLDTTSMSALHREQIRQERETQLMDVLNQTTDRQSSLQEIKQSVKEATLKKVKVET